MSLDIIVPKQSTPPVDVTANEAALFTKIWWLFFNDIADKVNTANDSNNVTLNGVTVVY